MNKVLVIERSNPTTIFMAALLSCTKEFEGADVRLLKSGEDTTLVNVTRANVERLCPSWASSELISRLIKFKVCAPIIDGPMSSISEKVKSVRETLEVYAKQQGLDMPS